METTYELKICGKIQHVGFRDKIENLGHAFGINGVVYNYGDGTVRILANFDDEELKNVFKENIKLLSKRDNLIKIEEISERELNSHISFPPGINRISADDLMELNKKLDEGVKYIKMLFGVMTDIKELQESLLKKIDNIDHKQDLMIDSLNNLNKKQDLMIKKQDLMIDSLNNLNKKQDLLITKMDENNEILRKIEKKL